MVKMSGTPGLFATLSLALKVLKCSFFTGITPLGMRAALRQSLHCAA